MASARAQVPYRRRQWIVNPPFQYQFVGRMLLLLLLLAVGALAGVYLALWMTLKTFELTREPWAVAQLTTVGLLVTIEMLLLAPVVIWIGIRMTHRVAGPLVRINAALQHMAQGNYDVHLTLRKGDSLIELANAINTLSSSLRSRRS